MAALESFLLAAGGAATAVVLVGGALWKFGSAAVLGRFKAMQDEQLERLKAELAQSATRTVRFENQQFGKYQEVWDMLADLRLAGDRLWDRATSRNVQAFGRAFDDVRKHVYGSQPLLEGRHLTRLQALIDQFRDFYSGKEGLVDLRNSGAPEEAILARIQENGQIRSEYEAVLSEIAADFRDQMRGPSVPASERA